MQSKIESSVTSSEVCWQANKIEFLLFKSKVVGVNTAIKLKLEDIEQERKIIIEIPVTQFSSGHSKRDEVVVDILSSKDHKNIYFESESLSLKKWRNLEQAKRSKVSGKLVILGEKYPVCFSLEFLDNKHSGKIVYARLVCHLTDFNIQPPKFILGIVSSVEDQIVLVAKLRIQDFKNGSKDGNG